MLGELAFPFIAGAIATVNPCGFALLPAYVARRLGGDAERPDNRPDAVFRALGLGAAATAGFILIFGLAGGALSLAGFALARGGLEAVIGRIGATINRASGAILFLAGAYISYYWGSPLFSPGLPGASGLIMKGERISGALRGWIGGAGGESVVLALSGALALLIVTALSRRVASALRRTPPPATDSADHKVA